MLCDEELNFCELNSNACLNGGRCTSLSRDDGLFICECPTGFRGRHCEMAPPSMFSTSTNAPMIIFPNSTINSEPSEVTLLADGTKTSSESPLLGSTIIDDLLHKNDSSTEDITNEAK